MDDEPHVRGIDWDVIDRLANRITALEERLRQLEADAEARQTLEREQAERG